MKLLHLHVENFGKLRDYDLELAAGANTVLRENGWGKSTLAAFIRVMFYGFENEKKRSALENERKRYAPWQGGAYGGYVDYEQQGKRYRLERSFGEKEDLVRLFDAQTGKEIPLDGNIGEELFGIDSRSFRNTVFVAQQGMAAEATSEINAVIGGIADEGADMARYRPAMDTLTGLANRLTPDRSTGQAARLKAEVASLETQVLQGASLEKSCVEAAAAREVTERELRALERSQAALEKAQASEKALLLRYQAEPAELARYRELSGIQPDINGIRIEETEEACGQLARLEALLSEMPGKRGSLEQLRRSEEISRAAGKKRRRIGAVLLVIGLLAAVGGLTGLFSGLPHALLYGCIGAGVLLAAGGVGLLVRAGRETALDASGRAAVMELEQDIRESEAEAAVLRGQLDGFLRSLGVLAEEAAPDQFLEQFGAFFQRYHIYFAPERAGAAVRSLDALQREYGRVAEALEKQAEIRPRLETLARRLGETEVRIREKQEALSAYDRQITEYEQQTEEISAVRAALAAKQEELAEAEHRHRLVKKTGEYLTKARDSFLMKYMTPMQEAFDKYYTMLTGSDTDVYDLDVDLNVRVKAQGASRDVELLSEGYQDLTGLCLRMAMIDAMYREEKPFLVFDDPFVNLDDEKTERGLAFLTALSGEYQVIYLTCHSSRGM